MGLRPSVKQEDSNNGSALPNDQNNNESSHEVGINTNSPNRSINSPSAPSTLTPPQREAWTARGQLLLNFHHAISRAINSPEMMRKCSQIAEDMSKSRVDDTQDAKSMHQEPSSINNGNNGRRQQQKQQHPANKLSRDDNNPIAKEVNSQHSSMSEEYSAEASLIIENKSKRDATLRNKSLAAGLLSFVALRSGRGLSSWVRSLIANNRIVGVGNSNGSGYRSSYQFESHLRPPVTEATFMKNHNNANDAGHQLLKQPSRLHKFLRLAVDATISTSIAILSGAFLFTPRPSAYIEDMSKLPLVKGKSVYAEMVCPPLLDEYRRVLEQYGGRWPVMRGNAGKTSNADDDAESRHDAVASTTPRLTQEDVSLNVIRKFVENCSKRSKYERALIEERNAFSLNDNQPTTTSTVSRVMKRMTRSNITGSLSESIGDEKLSEEDIKLGTVSIPSPGVPENIPVNLDQVVLSLGTDADYEEDKKDGRNDKI